MNWDAIGAVAEMLGAIGVIITLVYLARQIKQNSRQLMGASLIAVHEYQRSMSEELNSNPELFRMVIRGNNDFDALSSEEQALVAVWNLKEAGYWDMCYQLAKQGSLDPSVYQAKEQYMLALHSAPGRRKWFKDNAILLEAGFYREMTSKLDESSADFAAAHPYFMDDGRGDRETP